MFSECNKMKLEINNKEICKIHKYMEIKQHTTEQSMVHMNDSETPLHIC